MKLPVREDNGEKGFVSASMYEDLRSRMCRKRMLLLQLLFLDLIYSILLPIYVIGKQNTLWCTTKDHSVLYFYNVCEINSIF